MKRQLCFTAAIMLVLMGIICVSAQPIKIDINLAAVDELMTLPGVDEDAAQVIINGRPYTKRKDWLDLEGFDKRELRKLQRFILIRPLTLNLAMQEELERLPDITPETAEAIIAERPYKSVEELLIIPGMDQETLEKLRGFIQVRMNINAASFDELNMLPGIDSNIARAIIDGRSYETVDELLRIKGIDEEILAKLRGFIEAVPTEKGSDERGRKLPGQGR